MYEPIFILKSEPGMETAQQGATKTHAKQFNTLDI